MTSPLLATFPQPTIRVLNTVTFTLLMWPIAMSLLGSRGWKDQAVLTILISVELPRVLPVPPSWGPYALA